MYEAEGRHIVDIRMPVVLPVKSSFNVQESFASFSDASDPGSHYRDVCIALCVVKMRQSSALDAEWLICEEERKDNQLTQLLSLCIRVQCRTVGPFSPVPPDQSLDVISNTKDTPQTNTRSILLPQTPHGWTPDQSLYLFSADTDTSRTNTTSVTWLNLCYHRHSMNKQISSVTTDTPWMDTILVTSSTGMT